MAMFSTRWSALVAGVLVVSVAATVMAQQTPVATTKPADSKEPEVKGGMDFKANVGSFKLLGAGDVPAKGKLTFDFNGTVLVSGAEKTTMIVASPGVRREINDVKHNKAVYHGRGKMTIDGPVRAVQFFGRDLKARFYGRGIFRLYGEFDKNLDTGSYKLDGNQEARPWGTGGVTLTVPSIEQATPKPTVKIVPKGG